ncbi:alpha/beta fold hydrolase [Riemerella anatipestifer]|nr:alpha/beta fold hydrolase [Riemerella anatipestifer]MDY3533957.1 alpha/beta fold hydrolase [Riemerella anatipestifer]MDY3536171.1 alpha/beta fold hydrolase [Riemerella anatipestifer]
MLHHLKIKDYLTTTGYSTDISLSYELFGQPLHTAPIVLINHALTGNSNVAGTKGWWQDLVGAGKTIDTNKLTVICFNIPGNGYNDFFIDNPKAFTTQDVAQLFLLGLEQLKIKQLDYLIGGSIGGAIGWEMLNLNKNLSKVFVPVASDFKTTDWLNAQCLVQKYLLENSEKPLQKARTHAMLCYRTPFSLNKRFKRQKGDNIDLLQSHEWLNFHGESLNERFTLKAYLLMNHLLTTIAVDESSLTEIKTEFHLVSVDSDLFFPAFEIEETYQLLKNNNANAYYHEIKSVHGHDAFLMEYKQMKHILKSIIKY